MRAKNRTRMHGVIAAVAAVTMALTTFSATTWAAPDQGNPCDPEHGRYLCDGTGDQPDVKPCDPDNGRYLCDGTGYEPDVKPCDPDNGRYLCDGTGYEPDVKIAKTGDDGVSLAPKVGLPKTGF